MKEHSWVVEPEDEVERQESKQGTSWKATPTNDIKLPQEIVAVRHFT